MKTPKQPKTLNDLKFYVLRQADGRFYRRKTGWSNQEFVWVEDAATARIYNRIGPARTVVSDFVKRYPNCPIPDLVEISVGGLTVLDEAARIEKAIEKKKALAARREQILIRERAQNLQKQLQSTVESAVRATQSLEKANLEGAAATINRLKKTLEDAIANLANKDSD